MGLIDLFQKIEKNCKFYWNGKKMSCFILQRREKEKINFLKSNFNEKSMFLQTIHGMWKWQYVE